MKQLFLFKLFFLALSLFINLQAHAHLSGFTDTSIQIAQPGIRIIYTIPIDDLAELPLEGPDKNFSGHGKISTQPAVYYQDTIVKGWKIYSKTRNCHLIKQKSVELKTVKSYQYEFDYQCEQGLDDIDITYQLFVAQSRGHQNFTRIFLGGELQRMRFAFDKQNTQIPVQALLKEWQIKELDQEFFDVDPSKNIDEYSLGIGSDSGHIIQNKQATWSADPLFIWMGMTHIWEGFDHILFLFALLLIPMSLRKLVIMISLFTLAHSITLGLAYFQILSISPAITEPLIALTVMIIGIENLLIIKSTFKRQQSRTVLIFIFGLIHGIGLSYQLTATSHGDPSLLRLLFFNVGVELGQLTIVGLIWFPMLMLQNNPKHRQASIMLSSIVLLLGLFWVIERSVSLYTS
ncbi:HupE/UreJ family protein [Paraglaciecola sp.]|uniref:HupE/UreJ family protein n=1 Tax=Paraglaciecola sp. TaxID=1920173 RepID=UPI0030F43671